MNVHRDLVDTPLHRLMEQHRAAMAGFRLEDGEEAVFGGRCPWEVVQSGAYLRLEAGGEEGGVQGAITAALGRGRVVRLVGVAGGGKTTALQRLLADWAAGAGLKQFHFLFPLALGELDWVGEGRSLADLLSQQHPHLPADSLELVFQNPRALLFVLDGLDQNQDQNQNRNQDRDQENRDQPGTGPPGPPCSDPGQPAPLAALLRGLMQGSLLPGASVLVTGRLPGPDSALATDSAPLQPGPAPGPAPASPPQRVEVWGLSREARGALVRPLSPDAEQAEQALALLEERVGFYALARVPGFCWSLRSAFRAALEAGRDPPQTLTGVFSEAAATAIRRHGLGEEPAAALLATLGKMAAGAVLEGAGRCSGAELVGFGLPALDSPVMREFLRPHGPAHSPQSPASFRSPALAQFLLAVAYHRGSWDRGGATDLLQLARDAGGAGLLELFLAGLSDPSQHAPLQAAAGGFAGHRAPELDAWLRETTQNALQSFDRAQHLRALRLLHQRQDPGLVHAAVQPDARLGMSYAGLDEHDAAALSYVATLLSLEQLNLYASQSLTADLLLRLTPAMHTTRKIMLSQSRLSAECYPPLTAGLRHGAAQELDLSYSTLGTRGAQSLFAGLEGSRVETLRLPVCKLTEQDCVSLARALCSSQLHLLDLRGNDIQDAGLAHLSQALSSPQCRLQELGLGMCKLTGSSMEGLSQALCCRGSELQSLDLSNNQLGDDGMAWICTALREPHCSLRRLLVSACDLTGACCGGLADALRTGGGALMELDLSVNELEDDGVLQLTHAFQTANCAPKILRLARCELGPRAMVSLGAVLRLDGSPLRELEAGLHQVGDAGAKPLWEGLRDPACALELLDVEMLGLTDACVEEVCDTVKSSRTLKTLVLKNNLLTDAAVPALVAMAKNSRTLRELNLQYNDFSEDAFEIMDSCGKIKY